MRSAADEWPDIVIGFLKEESVQRLIAQKADKLFYMLHTRWLNAAGLNPSPIVNNEERDGREP